MDRSKQRKRKRTDAKTKPKKSEELVLESFLFGANNEDSFELKEDTPPSPTPDPEEEDAPLPLFIEDRVGAPTLRGSTDGEQESTVADSEQRSLEETESKGAWEDKDDEDIQVNIGQHKRLRKLRQHDGEDVISGAEYTRRLQTMHAKLYTHASWVETDKDQGDDSDDSDADTRDTMQDADRVLTSTGSLQTRSLSSGQVTMLRVKDANHSAPSQAVVQTVQFHPSAQLLLTAGLDKTLRLFQVDGRRNALVQSIFLPDLPIKCAAFSADGTQLLASGRRKFFYSYDLVAGKASKVPGIRGRKEKGWDNFSVSPDNKHLLFSANDGYMVLVDAKSKQWMGQLKMNGSVRSTAFSPDGLSLYSFGSQGRVYLWDLRQRRCRGVLADEGCVHGSALAADGRHLVTGQESGVVNIYDNRDTDALFSRGRAGRAAEPVKRVMSLVTAVDHMRINHSGELLAMASQRKKDALRLLHLPSRTIYTNWPTSTTPLHYVTAMDFSPSSGFLAIGNDRGKVLLYRLPHFAAA